MSDPKDPRVEQATDVPATRTSKKDGGSPPSGPGGVQEGVPPTGLDGDAKNAASRT